MDPAFLVWIPPIDEGNIMNEIDSCEPHYEEILPKDSSLNYSKNEESPEEEEAPNIPLKPPRKSLTNSHQTNQEIKALLSKSPILDNKNKKKSSESIQMLELTPRKLAPKATIEFDKETSIIIKAGTDNRIADYYGLSDIQFADDDLDDEVRYIDENKRVEENVNTNKHTGKRYDRYKV